MSTETQKLGVSAAQAAPTRVITAAEAATAKPIDLPPAGDVRKDEMKRRAEELQKAAAAFESDFGVELGAIDPAKLKHVDNEIGQHAVIDPYTGQRDGSKVEGALPDYNYYWAEARGNNGMDVEFAKASGWQVVDSGCPEELTTGRKYVDGTRRWGTAILMRIPKARAVQIQAAERRRVLARSEGISLKLLEDAERAGMKVHDLMSDKTPAYIRQNARAQAAAAEAARSTYVAASRQAGRSGANRVLASELANRRFEDALRKGSVPGMPVG